MGAEKDLEAVRKKALKVGAIKALVVDARETFVNNFVFPALQADAIYQGVYPLATALSRPLIAKMLVEVAHKEGASAVAHGCTGKGNDQVRFDVATAALGPDLKIIAPARDWGMTREQTIAYAKKYRIPVPVTVASPYSVDVNLWGRSIECGVLEDPWAEPPEEVYAWTVSPKDAPDEPLYVEIGFEKGIPISLNKKKLGGVALIQELHKLAGKHGVGRIDHIEDRLVGIKSREIYEAPAATVLFAAHKALEAMTLSKEQLRFKQIVAAEYASLIYNGLWFSSFHQDLIPYVQSTQRHVTGTVQGQAVQGQLHRGGPEVAVFAVPAQAGHVRCGRPVRSERLPGLHPHLGPAGQRAVAGPAGHEGNRVEVTLSLAWPVGAGSCACHAFDAGQIVTVLI